jgi:hypothetical protein
MTVVKSEKDELIPQRIVTGWRMCIDYQKLNKATKKDHFPLPFIDECWNDLQSILSFVSLMGILAIIKSRSTLMTKAKLLLLVPMEHMLIAGCLSNCAMLQLRSKVA